MDNNNLPLVFLHLMSSLADVVKQLQSLQKRLSELQSINSSLKITNENLLEQKKSLLEEISQLKSRYEMSGCSIETQSNTNAAGVCVQFFLLSLLFLIAVCRMGMDPVKCNKNLHQREKQSVFLHKELVHVIQLRCNM